jgi:hypothetical protein
MSTEPHLGTRVEVVPDDDASADLRIPKKVLEMLGPNNIMMSKFGHMMYVRASHWERIKHHFDVVQ